ncbi:hypothetical protein AB0O67_10035 [Streptomyces sp. NPDC086077]|uniref:hypothetical protein n=1 Tax=Streptomyces sp. NPDC086077 TaxID=3154862 RepID=UPI003422953A
MRRNGGAKSDHDNSGAARVVVGVSGSLGSLTALGRATQEARCRGAELWPVPAWEPPGGQLAASRSKARYCLAHARCPVPAVPPSPRESELAALHRRNAWRLRLDTREVTDRPESVRPES